MLPAPRLLPSTSGSRLDPGCGRSTTACMSAVPDRSSLVLFAALTSLAFLASLAGCPPAAVSPSPDLAVAADLATPPDLTSDAATVDLAGPYIQQPGCSRDAWCFLTPRPQGNTLLAVWGRGASDVWAGGNAGALVHYDGSTWQSVLSPTRAAIRGLWGQGPSNLFLVGDSATALHWDGSSFSPVPLPAAPARRVTTLYAVFGTSPTDVWMVGTGGVALHYDGASTLQVPTPDLGEVRAIWGPSPDSIYAVSSLGAGIQVLHYDAAAKSFSPLRTIATTASPTSLWGTGDDSFFIGTTNGEIYHVSKAAAVLANPKSNYGINAVWGSGSTVYAVGDVQYRSVIPPDITARKGSLLSLAGTTFTEVAGAPEAGFFGMWGSGPSDVFLVGTAGTIAHFDGTKFSTTSLYTPLTGVGAPLTGLAGTAAGGLLAVGDFGATLLFDGAAWTSRPDDVHRRFRGLAGDGNRLLAVVQDLRVSTGSEIQRWTGSAFTPEALPAKSDLRGIWSGGTLAVAVGANDLVLQRGVAGTWTSAAVDSAGTTVLRAAWAVSAGHIWAVGGGDIADDPVKNPARILLSDGTRYRPLALPVSDVILRGVWASSATDAWAVGDAGTMLHWNGAAWQEVLLPILATLNSVWGRDAATVYAVGSSGTILRWNGHDWKPEDSGTPSTLVNVWGQGSAIYALGANGTILRKSLP